MISGYCQCNLDIMGCGFRWENPVTSFKYLHIDSRRQISETSSNGTKSTCYLQFADSVFKYGKSNPSLPYPLNNVVPLIKLTQETIGWEGGEGSGRFFFFFKTLPTADNSHIRFVASSSHFHAFHVRLRKE